MLPMTGLCGGIHSTFEIANRLVERGHDVSIVYPILPPRSGASLLDLKKQLSRTRTLARNIIRGNRVEWFDVNARLVRVITANERSIPDGDIVVATWWSDAYTISDLGDEKGQKFYFIRHYEIFGGPEQLVDNSYRLSLTRLTTSSWLKGFIEEKFGVEVIGPFLNGLNLNIFYRESDSFKANRPRRVGMLYRDAPWKGMADGLAALLELKGSFPDFQLVLFGNKPTRADLPTIQKLGSIEYHRSPYKETLRRIYNSLDIFLFPSHFEGFGNPPMEAMACGAACVTTSVGGVPDFAVSGKTAMVISPGQPNQMLEATAKLLRDEDLRQEIARAGHRYIQQFTWEDTVDKLEELFESSL